MVFPHGEHQAINFVWSKQVKTARDGLMRSKCRSRHTTARYVRQSVRTRWRESYSSAKIQSVYSTALSTNDHINQQISRDGLMRSKCRSRHTTAWYVRQSVGTRWGESYSSAKIQSVYSTALSTNDHINQQISRDGLMRSKCHSRHTTAWYVRQSVGTRWGESYSSAKIQSVYSTALSTNDHINQQILKLIEYRLFSSCRPQK